jgi:hypothetical protein
MATRTDNEIVWTEEQIRDWERRYEAAVNAAREVILEVVFVSRVDGRRFLLSDRDKANFAASRLLSLRDAARSIRSRYFPMRGR